MQWLAGHGAYGGQESIERKQPAALNLRSHSLDKLRQIVTTGASRKFAQIRSDRLSRLDQEMGPNKKGLEREIRSTAAARPHALTAGHGAYGHQESG